MNQELSFGTIIRERRKEIGLTQTELAARVGCAPVTLRKIEYDALRPSVQIAEHLAVALNIPEGEQLAFVRLARREKDPSPLPPLPPAPEEIGGQDLSGRAIKGFQLGERIGAGGYGAVYRATQATVERDVAVKIILPKYADQPEFIRRFEAEAQLVARLEHPHIVPLYDYWREPGVAYLVMRFLRGGSLDVVLREGPLSAENIMPLMEQICAGLHAAHRVGIIHRDIKPANILLDEDGNAYLADFGIAKNLGRANGGELTIGEVVVGSPAYISPEQILAEPVKPQTDVYSLGVMLYELLTGRKPFSGPTPIAFIRQHLDQQLPLLAEAQNGTDDTSTAVIPTPLDIVIGRATAKNPGERYTDILTMLADIRRAIEPNTTVSDISDMQTKTDTPAHLAAMIDLPDLENPYKGLRAFGEADSADFFGRNTLIQNLLIRLAEESDLARFLAVVGPSGSGKSSVVKAGLLPALRQGGLPNSQDWFITEMLPGPHPLEELEAALLRVAVNPPDSLLTQLREDSRGLLRAVNRILPQDGQTELLLLIDQFEEVFTLVEDEAVRSHFLDSLVTAILDERSRLRVIITLRADFTDRPLQYIDFGELVRQRTEFVLPLTPDELEQAITGPTKRAGLSLETGLVPSIIGEIGDQPGMLPLLQYALTELFERREGRKLTLTAYQESGGVLGALARRADELYADLDEAEQEASRQLFLRLVTLGEGTEDTRRRVLQSELALLTKDEGRKTEDKASSTVHRLSSVVKKFGKYRLLTFDHDPVTRGPTVEVAHEALIREWSRLRGWIDDSREDIRLQRLLAVSAAEWQGVGQDEGFLLRGARLTQFEAWAETTTVALTEAEQAYLSASVSARQERQTQEEARLQRELETAQKLADTEHQRAEEQSQAASQLRKRAVFLTGALVIAGILAVVAVIFGQQASQNEQEALAEANNRATAEANAITEANQRATAEANAVTEAEQRATAQAQAEAQKEEAERQAQIASSRELAAAALNNLDQDPELSILLALNGLETAHTSDVEDALHQAIQASRLQRRLNAEGRSAFLEYSPDGTRLITSGPAGAMVWDAVTGQELFTLDIDEWVSRATFSPDGAFIVTPNDDGGNGDILDTISIWNAETGREILTFGAHSNWVQDVTFSPDGSRFASASGDSTAKIWDFATILTAGEGVEELTLTGHEADIVMVEFSPDGTRVATGDANGIVKIWDAVTGETLSTITTEDEGNLTADVTFSPDGIYLLTGGGGGSVLVWDVLSGDKVSETFAHGTTLQDIHFSPDGRQIVTASNDGTAKIWDFFPEGLREVLTLSGHTGRVINAKFSPDGQYVSTGGVDDGTVRIWDTSFTGSQELGVFPNDGPVDGLDFTADGSRLATSSFDGAARVWDVATGNMMITLTGHTDFVMDVAFSPDEEYLATASEDGTIRLWDSVTGEELFILDGHTVQENCFFCGVRAISFSPDGTRLASVGADGVGFIWNVATGDKLLTLQGHEAAINDIRFSPNGDLIATGSDDKSVKIWDAKSGHEVWTLATSTGNDVWSVAFSPDGHRLVMGDRDAKIAVWQLPPNRDGIPEELLSFVGNTTWIATVSFSPDGTKIVEGGTTGTSLWDAESGQLLLNLINSAVTPVAIFSPDGSRLATGGVDGMARIFTLNIDELTALAQTRLTRSLTEEECRQYLHVEVCSE